MSNINPFNHANPSPINAIAQAESDRATQEVQAAMVIAKKFPRNQMQAMDRILQACSRPTLAEGALYSYGRAGTDVTGPSIRLAEAIAQNWGNIQFGIRELSQSRGESTVEAFAWDIETNTRQVKVFQVPHVRDTKKGTRALTEARDIYEVVANNGARRLRACILGIIPGDVIEAAQRQCEETLSASADTSPEAIKKMLFKFAEIGVSRESLENMIQRRVDSITPALFLRLRKMYTSINDGMSTPEEWFDVVGLGVNKTPRETSAKTNENPPCNDKYLIDNADKWAALMQSGKKTPDDIIAMIESKFTLNAAQKNAIHALNAIDVAPVGVTETVNEHADFLADMKGAQ